LIRNIGIFAHVDAGKTTLTENILYQTGSIKKLGRVDHGLAHTDALDVERERGISVKSASVKVRYRNTEINIIDTPGHIDFSSEVERALMVLDGAILVVSCIEGVQSQTEIIWNALNYMKIPTLIFINKVDRLGANINLVTTEVQQLIKNKGLVINEVLNEGCKEIKINSNNSGLTESVCLLDEEMFHQYTENQMISTQQVNQVIYKKTTSLECVPMYYGAALNGIGISEIMDGIVDFLPKPEIHEELLGLVYKVDRNLIGGKMVHVRLYGGLIKVRDLVFNHSKNLSEKVTQLFKIDGTELIATDYLKGGDIGIVGGLFTAQIGDVIGILSKQKLNYQITKPTLTVCVHAKHDRDLERLVECFRYLEEEDPYLNIRWQKESRELQVQLMGMIQMEILTKIIQDRFNLSVIFEKPTVIYKEAPTKIGIGRVDLKTPFFGALEMQVKPLAIGTGVIFESAYTTDFIFPRFQNEVKEVVPTVLKEGVFGWEVTDLKVSITGGRSIKLATNPGDYKKLTPMPLMDALYDAEMTLLEPIQTFECYCHVNDCGNVLNDLYQMRGIIQEQEIINEIYYVSGKIPLSTSVDYAVKIASLSKGKSEFKSKFLTYQACSLDLGMVRKRSNVDPSNHTKYLLSVLPKKLRDISNHQ